MENNMIQECESCEHRIVRYNYCPVIEVWLGPHTKSYSDHLIPHKGFFQRLFSRFINFTNSNKINELREEINNLKDRIAMGGGPTSEMYLEEAEAELSKLLTPTVQKESSK